MWGPRFHVSNANVTVFTHTDTAPVRPEVRRESGVHFHTGTKFCEFSTKINGTSKKEN